MSNALLVTAAIAAPTVLAQAFKIYTVAACAYFYGEDRRRFWLFLGIVMAMLLISETTPAILLEHEGLIFQRVHVLKSWGWL